MQAETSEEEEEEEEEPTTSQRSRTSSARKPAKGIINLLNKIYRF